MTIPSSIKSGLFFAIASGFFLFVLIILSGRIPEKIERGVEAQAAIKQLDAIRRPMLKIKAIVNSEVINGDSSTAIAELDAASIEAESILGRYLELSEYNTELSGMVKQFASVYKNWVAKERWLMQHMPHTSGGISHSLEHLVEADQRLLAALEALGKGEDPIHEDINDGQHAVKTAQVASAVLIIYLFVVIIIAQHLSRRLIAEREEELATTLQSIGDAVISTDIKGCIIRMNPVAEQLTGWHIEQALGEPLSKIFVIENSTTGESITNPVEKVLENGKIIGLANDTVLVAKDGKRYQIADSAAPIMSEAGVIHGIVLVFHDVTADYEIQQQLRLAATTFETHSGIIITDRKRNILRVNPAMEAMTGYSVDEMIGNNPNMLKSDKQDDAFYQELWLQVNKSGYWQGELWNRKKDGSQYAEYLTITAVKNELGEITNYVGTSYDITERKNAEDRIEYLAYYDDLTELANRRLLIDRIDHELLVATRHQTFGVILYLDLDRFKNLNDALGHSVGDELLRQVAIRLREVVRSEDTVSRLGGDEFVIMLPATNDDLSKASNEANMVADKIRGCLNEVFDLNGYNYHLNTSIGIVVFPEVGESSEDILKHADSALYLAKEEGRNASRFYKPSMQKNADIRLQLEKDLRYALKNNELVLEYQPQVGLDGHISGAEALLRWYNPQRGVVLPNQFIPLAEETGLILEIGNWVLNTAARQVSRWHEMGICPNSRNLAVNISPRQFHQSNFVEYILEVIDIAGVEPGCIELEITENLLMDKIGDVVNKLSQLREYEIKIAIDDFGTGYSSLSYLKTLPLDKLKIDQSFVRDLVIDSNDAAIVDTIISMSKHLELDVIAEGVETKEQLDFLKSKGCRVFQGYYFSKAVSEEELLKILKNDSV